MSDEGSSAVGDPQRMVLFATPECAVEAERSGDVVTVALSGEVDLENADAVCATIAAMIAEHPGRLDIDLADLDFIDSFGISRLILAQQTAVDAGVTMSLRRPRAATRRVFVVSGLIAYLNVD